MKYCYKLYNLVFQSDILLYNIPQTHEAPQAYIEIADVIDEMPDPSVSPLILKENYTSYYSEFAFFEILNGTHIKMHPYKELPSEMLVFYAAFAIGWNAAFLFNQRGYSVFHCSALNINDKGVIVSGYSGAGKSTIANMLINKGHQYIADDMAIISAADDLKLIPAYPIRKLCGNEISGLPSDRLYYFNETRDKYSYLDEASFCAVPKAPDVVVLLKVSPDDELKVQEMTGLNKFTTVLKCLYLNEEFQKLKYPPAVKFTCLKIAERARVFEILRPMKGDTRDQIVNIIESFTR